MASTENYGSVLRDCGTVITISPKSLKAYYRSVQALVELERFEEAIDCCKRSLAIQEDKDTRSILEKAEKKKAEKDAKAKETQEHLQKEKMIKLGIKQALQVCLLHFDCGALQGRCSFTFARNEI